MMALGAEVKALNSRSKVHLRSVGSLFGSVLWIIIVVLLLVVLWYLIYSCMRKSRPVPSAESLLRGAPQQDRVVPPPVLCSHLIQPNNETRFVVSYSSLADPSSDRPISVYSPGGSELLLGQIHEAIMLSLSGSQDGKPHVMVRGVNQRTQNVSSMLSILDTNGAYFGKVAVAPTGQGLVVYQKMQPSCMVKAKGGGALDIQVCPIRGGGDWIAKIALDGDDLKFAARPGADSALFLAVFLGMIFIEPGLLQLAEKSDMQTIMSR